MTISYKKMLHVGLMAGLLSLNIINSAQAASRSDDQMVTGSACMVTVDDTESLKRINVQYIRLLYIDKTQPTKLHISMASNFNAGDTLQFLNTYENAEKAKIGMETLSDQITFCREKAMEKNNSTPKNKMK